MDRQEKVKSEESEIDRQMLQVETRPQSLAGFSLGSDYQVSYGFDSLGRFASITSSVQSVSSVANYSYLQNSDLIEQRTMDSGLRTTRTYEDHRNLLTQVKNQVDSTTLSQYDYANDSAGRRTLVKHSGSAFAIGPAFNKYDYNSRSEVIVGDKFWGTNPEDTSDPVLGQGFAYAYDNIGNRTASSRDNEESIYTANNLNQYSQRTLADLIDIIGSAETNTTVTVNDLPTSRHGKYWHKALGVNNMEKAAYPEIKVVGVYNPDPPGEEDVVSEEKGRVFVAQTPEQFSYDADGNMIQDGRFNYSWDCENRLIGVETRADLPKKVPRVKVEFTYDYMSRRAGKKVYSKKDRSGKHDKWRLRSVSSFLYDGWNLVEEMSVERKGQGKKWEYAGKEKSKWKSLDELADDDCEECEKENEQDKGKGKGKRKCHHKRCQKIQYVWGLDLSGSLQGAGGIGGLLTRVEVLPGEDDEDRHERTHGQGHERHGKGHGHGHEDEDDDETMSRSLLYTYDGNGNVSELLNPKSAIQNPQSLVVAHYEYSPFGETIVATGSEAQDNPFRFSTKYFVDEISLGDWGMRWNSPSLGRWLARDPIGRDGGLNLYGFVGNNPQNGLDLLGLLVGDVKLGHT